MYCLRCKGMTKKQELKIKIEKLYKKVKKQKSNALATTYKGRKEKHLQMTQILFANIVDDVCQCFVSTFFVVPSALRMMLMPS